MKKLLVLLSLLNLVSIGQSQIVFLDTSFNSSLVYETIMQDSIRITATIGGIRKSLLSNNQMIGSANYSRYHYCLNDERRFLDLEALPNGSYAGAFLYDESCTPPTIVMLVMDSVGNRVKEYYFEDYLYGIAEIIVTEDDFHLYVQNKLTGEDMETRHLTFDFDGNLLDSNRFVNERHYFGQGAADYGDKMVRYGDSLLVSYWDGDIHDNKRGLALFDMNLSDEPRLLMDGSGVFISGITLDEDTVTVAVDWWQGMKSIRGIQRIGIKDDFKRSVDSIHMSAYEIMQFNEYVVILNHEHMNNEPQQLAIYNSDLVEVYTMSAPSGGRMQQLSDSTFMLYGQGYGAKTFIYTVDLDSLRAITPPRISDSASVGIVENLQGQLSIFPNPTSSTLNINFEQAQEATVGIYSLTGALLLERQVNTQSAQLDVSGLPEGMYLVRVSAAQGIESQKVIIGK